MNPATAYDVPGDTSSLVTDVRLDGIAVLVVDDQPDSREMVATLLEQHGGRSMQSDSAESAIQILQVQRVDLLIADIAMPKVDGYELMRRLRAAGDETPAIAVTAFARSDDRRSALECAYTAYLSKPIDGRELAKMVREVVSDVILHVGRRCDPYARSCERMDDYDRVRAQRAQECKVGRERWQLKARQ